MQFAEIALSESGIFLSLTPNNTWDTATSNTLAGDKDPDCFLGRHLQENKNEFLVLTDWSGQQLGHLQFLG